MQDENAAHAFAGVCIVTATQIIAAKIVIGKSIPDLKSIEYKGNDEKPVQRHMIVEFVEPKPSEGES